MRRSPAALRRFLTRTIYQENVFLFLLAARWLSLVPPFIALWWRPVNDAFPIVVFGCALAINALLSFRHQKIDRYVMRHPVLLGADMMCVAAFLGLTGGAASPYFFYALTPILAAAFFFSLRGGFLAALSFSPLYLLAVSWPQMAGAPEVGQRDAVAMAMQLFAIYATGLVFGYQSALLRRLRASSAELREVQRDLGRAETLAALGKMVAHVSHEIRNPLTTLGGYAARLQKKSDDPEAVRRHATIIQSEIARLEELLNNLLDISRPRNQNKELGDLNEVLERACLLAGDRSQIEWTKKFDKSLPPMEINAAGLLQAFLNVLRNAIQAMPDGGVLTVVSRMENGKVVVTISDTGCGIAPEKLSEIWQPFVTHKSGGTGLGLTVTQQIIGEHGGCVEVESEVGKGTTFRFRLPIGVI